MAFITFTFILLFYYQFWSVLISLFIFKAVHGMPAQTSNEKGVCLSLHPSVKCEDCDKKEERSVQIFIPYERSLSLVFLAEKWMVGLPLLREIFCQLAPVKAKSPIFNRYSLVAPQP